MQFICGFAICIHALLFCNIDINNLLLICQNVWLSMASTWIVICASSVNLRWIRTLLSCCYAKQCKGIDDDVSCSQQFVVIWAETIFVIEWPFRMHSPFRYTHRQQYIGNWPFGQIAQSSTRFISAIKTHGQSFITSISSDFCSVLWLHANIYSRTE